MDACGWTEQAKRIDSPNHDERPQGARIELVIIHGISLPPGVFGGTEVIDLFTNRLRCEAHPYFEQLRRLRVSSHFYIRRSGETVQFVSCLKRAWHAGVSSWQGRSGCNDFSVGIELEGTDELPYEDAQYRACGTLLASLRRAFPIRAAVGHCDVAPGRKTDPGPCFDWSRLSHRPR